MALLGNLWPHQDSVHEGGYVYQSFHGQIDLVISRPKTDSDNLFNVLIISQQ